MIPFKPSLLFLSCLITVLSISNNGVNAVSCGAGSKCPSSSPCCSAEGTCGSGAMQCAGGCQAMWSNQPSSCLPNPVCQNQNITITPGDFNNSKMFKPILEYNGDATQAPFTLDYGSTGAGPEGVLLELTAARQAKISTTRYFLYGEVEVTARHEALDGVVAALISMSDAKDELDWEFTTSDGTKGYTNWFSLGVVDNNNGGTSTIQPSVASWHTIGLNWTPSSIQWKLDGTVVRTVKASTLGDKFPTTPARFQMSLWSGGNSTNSDGVIQWAGGPTDWTSSEYTQNGYYSQEIKSFTMTCGDASSANLQTVGTNTAAPVTSYIYTGANDTNTGRPTIQLSTNPISFLKNPSKDGMAGIPGYSDGSSDSTKKTNVWDGTGDQNDSDSSSSSGDGSIFSKNAALKYGVPIGAAVVGLIVIWAIITACVRRNRGKNLKAPALGAVGSTLGGIAGGKAANSKYQALGGEDTDGLPMGATRKGAGVTAAVGPSPSTRYGNVAPGQAQRQGSNQGGMRDMRQQSSSNSNGSYRPSYAAHEYDPYANYSSPQPQQQPQYRTQSPYQPYQQQQQQSRGVTFTPAPQNYRQGNGYPNYQEPSYRDRY